MAESPTAPKPLDLAVLMAFGVRLHLFTRERGEEARARLREGLGKAHTPIQIAEWLEISPGELEQLIRAVRRLSRDCPDADLVAAFRRRATEEGLLAVGTPRKAPVPDARSVSIGAEVFSDPALPSVPDFGPAPRGPEWGRVVALWTRMSLITSETAANLLGKIASQPKESLTGAILAGWLGVGEATLEQMLRVARTLPDDVPVEEARTAFEEARLADPHDLGTIEFGINTPSSSFLKPFVPPEPAAPPALRPSEDRTKVVTAPPPVPPAVAPMRPSEEETKVVSSSPPRLEEVLAQVAPPPPQGTATEPRRLEVSIPVAFGPYVLPGGFGLDGTDEAAAVEALGRRLAEGGGVAPDADATALAKKLFERWARDVGVAVLTGLKHVLVPVAVVRAAGGAEGPVPVEADDVLLEYDGAPMSTSYSYCAAKDAAVQAGKKEVDVVVRRRGEVLRLRVDPFALQLQLAVLLELRPLLEGGATSPSAP
ncbi:MAG: hypothetical protein AAB434_12605 [Planctomycetota bacterium]